jgi:P27 family predicted phage terminase small subunit
MGKRGPLPRSKREAELAGSRVRARNRPAPKPLRRVPDPPAWLQGEARRIFRHTARKLAATPWFRLDDVPALARYAHVFQTWKELELAVEAAGSWYEDQYGNLRAHPAATQAASKLKELRELEKHLGLAPTARQRMDIPLGDDPEEEAGDADESIISFA